MRTIATNWRVAFEAWLAPFLVRLGRVEQRRWAPVCLQGLLGPGERKSVEPMAARVAPGDVDRDAVLIVAETAASKPSWPPWRTELADPVVAARHQGRSHGRLRHAPGPVAW